MDIAAHRDKVETVRLSALRCTIRFHGASSEVNRRDCGRRVPALTAILVIALPFIDRRLERRPWKRPLAVGIYLAILGTLITFGLLSKRDDRLDPAIAKQVVKQDEETNKD